MRRIKTIAVPVLALGLALPLAGQSDPEQQAFDRARTAASMAAWEAFLAEHGKSSLAAEARRRLDDCIHAQAVQHSDDPARLGELFGKCRTAAGADRIFDLWSKAAWDAANKADTRKAFRDFLTRFPSSPHATTARAKAVECWFRECEAQNSIPAWQEFLNDRTTIKFGEQARQRLGVLMFERAKASASLDDWRLFVNRYEFAWRRANNPDLKAMLQEAKVAFEASLYEEIVRHPTLGSCAEYERQFPAGPHRQHVAVKKEACVFEQAIKTNTVNEYLAYLRTYPTGYRDAEVRRRLEDLIFTLDTNAVTANETASNPTSNPANPAANPANLTAKPTSKPASPSSQLSARSPTVGVKTTEKRPGSSEKLTAFETYLRQSPKNKEALLARMEPVMRAWALEQRTTSAFERYLGHYQNHAEAEAVRTAYDPVLFAAAEKEDWHTAYSRYLRLLPQGQFVTQASERLDFLRKHPAELVLDYPAEVGSVGGRWTFVTKLREKSGKAGVRVSARGWVVNDKGARYGPNGVMTSRAMKHLPAGGSATDSYWCRGAFSGGYVTFTWSGEDAGGHRIQISQRVKLK